MPVKGQPSYIIDGNLGEFCEDIETFLGEAANITRLKFSSQKTLEEVEKVSNEIGNQIEEIIFLQDFTGNSAIWIDDVLPLFPNVTSLCLYNISDHIPFMKTLDKGIKNFTGTIKKLKLSITLRDVLFFSLQQCALSTLIDLRLSELEELYIEYNAVRAHDNEQCGLDSRSIYELSKQCPNIKSFTFHDMTITSQSVEYSLIPLAINEWENLEYLCFTIGGAKTDFIMFRHLMLQNNTKVKHIKIIRKKFCEPENTKLTGLLVKPEKIINRIAKTGSVQTLELEYFSECEIEAFAANVKNIILIPRLLLGIFVENHSHKDMIYLLTVIIDKFTRMINNYFFLR